MEFSYFTKLTSRTPLTATMEKIVGRTRTSPAIIAKTTDARKWYQKGRKRKGDNIKIQMPAFAPAAILDSGKSKDDVIDLTGLCFLDIDHISEDDAIKTVTLLSKDPFTRLASISVSGKGVHLLVRYTVDFGDYDDPFIASPEKLRKLYKDVFLNLAEYYTQKLGLQVDMSGENAERLCIVSHDPKVYYNGDSTAYIYDITNNTITNTI
jgi:hypothetical protein